MLHEESDFFLPGGGVLRHSVLHSTMYLKPVLQPSTLKQKSDRFFAISSFTMNMRFTIDTMIYPQSTLNQLKHPLTLVHYQI